MSIKESTIENDGRKYALSLGIACYKFKSDNNRAVPDRLFINQYGVTFYIEYKREGQKPTDQQKRKAKEMGHPMTPIFWADSKEVSRQIIDLCADLQIPRGLISTALVCGLDEKYTCFDL